MTQFQGLDDLVSTFPKVGFAYGVDPHRAEYYSLRQARYDALAADIDVWAAEALSNGRKLRLVDVGGASGRLFRHLEPRPHCAAIEISATDIEIGTIYRGERYASIVVDDLMAGNPNTPSNAFDVVVCEQVLEHLPRVDLAIAALERVAKPGGKVCVGVPIFLPPLAALRNAWVQASLAWRPNKKWSHIQTFSQRSFLRQIRRHSRLELVETRGFRIISGGPLRPLEHHRWWWRFNRLLGALAPWACIEIQAIFERPANPDAPSA
jgi:2-polyprenyl-3-methyl-5-hydroxy-6-metoxy-1,4-benzoquinol methylase